MPVAAVGAVAVLGASAISAKAGSNASKASLSAQSEALAYEREKDAQRKAEYDRAVEMNKKQQEDWYANRRAILARYGINVPAGTPGGTGGNQVRAMAGAQGSPVTLGTLASSHRAITPVTGDPMQQQGPQSVATPPQPQDAFDWQNWNRYASIR